MSISFRLPLALVLTFSACDASNSNGDVNEAGASNSGLGGQVSAAGGRTSTGGVSAMGGSTVMNPPANYPHNSPNAKFPFPQGKKPANCELPVYNTDTLATAYTNWKTKFFVGGRVIRTENNNDVVSEGIAYGMLIGVYMNDKPLFDTLWAYAQSKFDSKGLMNWHYDANGAQQGSGSATDADEDMAWALLMADAQWGGYKSQAVTLIDNIYNNEIEPGSNAVKPGDNFSSPLNPSYFAPSYYRVFAKVSSKNWQAVIDAGYNLISASSGSLGLIPNWATPQGSATNGPNNDANGPYYGYDACRTPFRIAHDYCLNGEPRAKAYLDKLVGFFTSKAPQSPGALADGYTATGENPPGTLGDYTGGMAFFGPAGVAAMSNNTTWAGLTATSLGVNTTRADRLAINGVFNYYNGSWGVLSLLALSGNFSDFTQ